MRNILNSCINRIDKKFLCAREKAFWKIGVNQVWLFRGTGFKIFFKSSNFKLQTSKAVFNKIDQTATSKESSKFQSEGTVIVSEGFEITENGNIIFFNGKTKLNLDK